MLFSSVFILATVLFRFGTIKMLLDDKKQVWAPDGREGFKLGKIVDIGSDNITIETFDKVGQVKLLLHRGTWDLRYCITTIYIPRIMYTQISFSGTQCFFYLSHPFLSIFLIKGLEVH